MNNLKWLFVLCILPVIISCNNDGNDEETIEGFCVNLYDDPLITIFSVTELSTQYNLSQVFISDIYLNGQEVDLYQLSQDNLSNFSIDADDNGNSGSCTLPCSFLEGEGDVSFVVSADGYQSKTIEMVAEYQSFEGGCPSYSSEGVELDIKLEPAL